MRSRFPALARYARTRGGRDYGNSAAIMKRLLPLAVLISIAHPARAESAAALCAAAKTTVEADLRLASEVAAVFGKMNFAGAADDCVYPLEALRYASADVLLVQFCGRGSSGTIPPIPGGGIATDLLLSAGHGSMLLYSLHLTGYDLPLEQIRQFRQWGSLARGIPNGASTPGIETTTGPPGSGFANGVGMAIAESTWLRDTTGTASRSLTTSSIPLSATAILWKGSGRRRHRSPAI